MNINEIYEWIMANLLQIIICIGLISLAIKLANMVIKIISVAITILILVQIFLK